MDVTTACPGGDLVPEVAEGEEALREAVRLAEPLEGEEARSFVEPLIVLFGESWTRCFYSRNWQCRVAAQTHLASTSMELRVSFTRAWVTRTFGSTPRPAWR